MKRKNIILATGLFIAMITGCSVKEDGIYGSFPYLEIKETNITLSKMGQSYPVEYESNRKVSTKVKSPEGNWLTAEAKDGQLILTFGDNPLETTRTATVTLVTQNSTVKKEIQVTQDASGEVTLDADLVLRNSNAIANNTYTKTTGSLIVGDVLIQKTKATSEDRTTEFMDGILTAGPSDIDDTDMGTLTEQIHMVGSKALAIINTEVSRFPTDLIKNNEINVVHFVHNEMSSLPEASVMQSLGLTELSVKGNDISDISVLEGCSSIRYLDIEDTDVYDLDILREMTGLQKAVITGVSVSKPQLEVFMERFDKELVVEGIDSDNARVPIIDMTVEELDDTRARISARITKNRTNGISKAGFYIGSTRKVDEMQFHELTPASDGSFSMEYQTETLVGKVFHVRAAAVNSYGEGFSSGDHFGSLIAEENIMIRSEEELQEFYTDSYSHINGSLYLGDIETYNNGGILLTEGTQNLYFGKMGLTDLEKLRGLVYVRDGIYIGNTSVTSIEPIAHVTGVQTLWLKGNRISSVPELGCSETLTSLDISRNSLTDFSFLDKLPALERLSLGDRNNPSKETNDIGILTGLEQYTNLKYIDLSGLPLHSFQVDDLRKVMTDCEIVFQTGNRTPHLPSVSAGSFTKGEQKVTLNAYIVNKGKSDIIEYGFYFGKNIDDLKRYQVGEQISENVTFSLELDIYDEDVYYFRPYAVSALGETRAAPKEFSLAYEDLSEYGTANCYIVTKEGKYRFDATVKGFSSQTIRPMSVEILWETRHTNVPYESGAIIRAISLVGEEVEFETTGNKGNALIAVKDASGTILWSWHIWATDMPGTQDWVSQYGTFKVMDRNLGATRNDRGSGQEWRQASGTLYQWGRKDPFVYESGFNLTSSSMSLAETVANPTTFIGAGDRWTTDEQKGLWQIDTKSMWDPCPPGYMVVRRDALEHIAWNGWEWDYGRHLYYNNYNGGTDVTWIPANPHIDCWGNNINYEDRGQIRTTGQSGWLNPQSLHIQGDGAWWNEPSAGEGLPTRCMMMADRFLVQTLSATSSENTITANGKLILNMEVAITEKGFVYSKTDSYVDLAFNDGKVTMSDSSRGNYSYTITDLAPNTTYYLRAYAIGDGETKYGEIIRVNTASPGSGEGFTGDDFEW